MYIYMKKLPCRLIYRYVLPWHKPTHACNSRMAWTETWNAFVCEIYTCVMNLSEKKYIKKNLKIEWDISSLCTWCCLRERERERERHDTLPGILALPGLGTWWVIPSLHHNFLHLLCSLGLLALPTLLYNSTCTCLPVRRPLLVSETLCVVSCCVLFRILQFFFVCVCTCVCASLYLYFRDINRKKFGNRDRKSWRAFQVNLRGQQGM